MNDEQTLPTVEEDESGRPIYTAENVDLLREQMIEFRKTSTTWAVQIDGPFAVETSEGTMVCEDGWLALDSADNPYPIERSVFADTYEPLFLDEPEPQTAPPSEPVDEQPAVREAVGVLPLDTPALVGQLAHRITYLELVVTGLVRQLVTNGIMARDFEQRSIETADRALAGAQRARATTPGRGGLVALELIPAAPKE